MDSFREYLLQEKKLTASSTGSYLYSLSKFSGWLQREGLTVEEVTYSHLLLYIKERQQRGEKKKYVNQGLTAVRHYYGYLIHRQVTDYNPASNLHVRGVPRRLPHGLLEREELDTLYQRYNGNLRNKVLLGLLVFQGLAVTELQQLQPNHIDLTRAKVTVPATATSNGRTLPLEACQVLELQNYLASHTSTYLLTAARGSNRLQNVVAGLMAELKKTSPQVKNAAQLRQSVIACWLKHKDVRVVQQLAGHRHVSSTQRYQEDRLRALQEDVASFHPLG